MFLNGALAAGATRPADAGRKGMDLSGTNKLVFYAKGQTGKEKVEFFMGGYGWENGRKTEAHPDSVQKVSLGYVRLSKQWEKYEISLGGYDLSDIQCGFGWVTSRERNKHLSTVKFYLDVFIMSSHRPG